MTKKERARRNARALRSIAADLDKQGQRMPLTYKSERERLHTMADQLRKRATELEESGVR